jgi:glycerate dehydrogenase
LPALKYIGVMATGYNIVDAEAARERNISVTNVPIYGTNSVAQMVFAHVLNLTQRVADHAQAVSDGRWATAIDWCFWDVPLRELEGATMGIIGLGRIGRAVAHLAEAFGMQVLATSPSQTDVPDFIQVTDLETLFRKSDVVSLHCPLTEQTRGTVNRERLAMMKPTAYCPRMW